MSCKDRRGVGGSGTEYESWGLYVLVGGDGTRYCGERAGATVKLFGLGEEGAGNLVSGLPGWHFVWREEQLERKCGDREEYLCTAGFIYKGVGPEGG